MAEPLHIEPGELSATEILDELTAGRRILVTVEMLGQSKQISLRYDGEIYYCDTPTRLHKHRDRDEMQACIQEMGYGE